MVTATEIERQLRDRAQGTPYVVSSIAGGVRVELDIADLRWLSMFHANRMSRTYTIDIMLNDEQRKYSKEQITRGIEWHAGLTGGVPQFSYTRSVVRGTQLQFAKTQVVGLHANGRLVDGYRFDSREMSDFVDTTLHGSGWRKKMDRSSRIGLIAALAAGGGAILLALIATILIVTSP
jgi:hypothetical protein